MTGAEKPPVDDRATSPFSREVFLSLYLPAIAISLGQGIVAPVLPIYAKSFDVDFATASLAIVMFAVGGVAATLPTGYLIDRIGRRPVLIWGPVLTALTSILTAYASPTFAWLLIWRFIGGGAAQAWELSRLAMITDSASVRQRARLMVWMLQMSSASMLIAPSIGGFVAAWDIRAPFILHGVVTLLAILPSIKLAKETDPARTGGAIAAASSEGAKWKYVLAAMWKREMLAFLAAQFLANIARTLTGTGVANFYAAYAYNASAVGIGLLNTASSVVTLPVGFLTAPIMDRWGRKKTIIPGFSLLFIGLLLVGATALFNSPFSVFIAAYLFVNVAQSITSGNMQVLGADLAPAFARGRFIGAWRLVGRAGGAVGPALFGWVAVVSGYPAGFAALALSSLGVAGLVGFFVGETVTRKDDPPAPVPSPTPAPDRP